jgi:lipopolysaccharide biosynthesis regulator YciM
MFTLRKKDQDTLSHEAYVEALRKIVDGHAEEAYRSLQTSVKGGIAPADAYIRLGNLLRERGDAARAAQIHQSLTVKDDLTRDEKIELYLSLADDYAALGKSEKSVKTLESAAKLFNIRDHRVFIKIAKHYHVVGDVEKAYESLKEARKHGALSERELALYLTTAAERLIEQKDFKEARKILQRALKHDPDCPPALLYLGDVDHILGETDEAIDRWRRTAVLSPQLAETALNRLERVLFEKGRFGDIEAVYGDVRAARGGDEAATVAMAAFMKKQGRGEEAIQFLEEYLTVFPDSVRATLLLTSLYARYRDSETLQHFLDEAITRSGRNKTYVCRACQFQSRSVRWHCPRCNSFDSFAIDDEI